jgi:hypothetical protein
MQTPQGFRPTFLTCLGSHHALPVYAVQKHLTATCRDH